MIVKLGGKGVFWSDGLESVHFPAFPVAAVDSVGAGDAFNGGLAVGLSDGLDMAAAIRWGLAAGALSVMKSGAQPSMPDPRGGGNTPDLSRPAPLPAAQRQLPLMPELKATFPRLTTIRSNEVDSRRAILEWRER